MQLPSSFIIAFNVFTGKSQITIRLRFSNFDATIRRGKLITDHQVLLLLFRQVAQSPSRKSPRVFFVLEKSLSSLSQVVKNQKLWNGSVFVKDNPMVTFVGVWG